MKLSCIALVLVAATSCSSRSVPPALVTDAFAQSFPNTIAKNWEEEDGNYEASFTKDGKIMSATFTTAGVLEETETDIKISELPVSVTGYIKTKYNDAVIKEASIIVKGNDTMYEAEVNDKDLLFDESGTFLNEEED